MIIWGVACFIATFLIIFLVVVQYPYKFTSYLALSFVALIDGLWLYGVIIPFCRVKEKPKTISKPLVFWLCMVLYCCFVAAGFLTDAYIASANTVVLVFDCIFAAMGLAAVVGLGYQFVVYIALKICLRYGKDATAEFTDVGKSMWFEYGKAQTNSYRSAVRYGIIFKYEVNGVQKSAKSRRVFSREEVEHLQTMGTFKIKYNKHTAIINETL